MSEFWEDNFKNKGIMWGREPSDSALLTCDLFKKNQLNKILIPGVGYGRNASVFYQNGFDVTGIEISKSAIVSAKDELGLNFKIHHGSVTEMPFDNKMYDGIFCYALIHLLNKYERRKFIQNCWNQLKSGGFMVFTVVSKSANMFGNGKLLSKDRYELMKGVNVYFYDLESATREFEKFGLVEIQEIDEPIKHMEGEEPLKCILVKCKKLG